TRCYRDWSSDVCSSDLEDALASAEAVPSSVPAEEAALVELLADPIDRSDHPFVQIVDEPDRRQQQQRGIHRLRSEGLDEDAAPRSEERRVGKGGRAGGK